MTSAEFSCLEYWRNRYRAKRPLMEFAARQQLSFSDWQNRFRAKFLECLGKIPNDQVELDLRIEEEVETEHFRRKRIVYRADSFSSIPAYLFVPKHVDSPAPAVVCPHGHGRGKVDPTGIAETESEQEHLANYNYAYARQFAERGYITLAPDLRCFGERTDDPNEVYGHMEIEEGEHWCDINFVLGMLMGYNLLTLHVFDIGRGIDLLQSMPEVASERIGCVGLSQGGTTTLFSAAYDQRIKVAGVSGYLNSWKSFPLMTGQICGSQVVPGLLEYGDHPEIAGLICPRPLFIESAIGDPIFPIDAARWAFGAVTEIYEAAGAEERLEREEFEGLHQFRGNRIFDFFDKWL